MKPRLIVFTDISSCEAGVREPDDAQSLVRLLHYANDIDIEGLCATSNMGHGYVCRPELIHQVLEAYALDWANLQKADPAFPPADTLRRIVFAGEDRAGPDIPVSECVGNGRLSPAARHLIAITDKMDERPLWVAVWGGTVDIAQALYYIKISRSPKDYGQFVNKLRILAIADQDSTGKWIRAEHSSLWYWLKTFSFRGIYRGGDTTLVSQDWVNRYLKNAPSSALARLYPNYKGGDIWSKRLGGVTGIKEGDTPSWMGILPNGLHFPELPELGGWGGRAVKKGAAYYEDAVDEDVQSPDDPDTRMSTVYRWRADFQEDFRRRLGWATGKGEPFRKLLHLARPLTEVLCTFGQVCRLELADYLPDEGLTHVEWLVYPDQTAHDVVLSVVNGRSLGIEMRSDNRERPLSIVLKAKYGEAPCLIRYARIVLRFG